MNKIKLSFIIPAYNEEDNIEGTLLRIQRFSSMFQIEIIVIDNNSSDRTAILAQEHGAIVFNRPSGTISSLRNYGAMHSSGDILVFLDADVWLSEQWGDYILDMVDQISNTKVITGSHCSVPKMNNFLSKHWFSNLSKEKRTAHLGSGHMIISKNFFNEINGFDNSLLTGEDYDICQRAVKKNGHIYNNNRLKAYHMDYPSDLFGFIKREAWHGIGDFTSVSRFISSKVAILSVAFIILNFATIYSATVNNPSLLLMSLFSLFFLLLASSYYKFKDSSMLAVITNSFVFYFYYLSRFLSLFLALYVKLRCNKK